MALPHQIQGVGAWVLGFRVSDRTGLGLGFRAYYRGLFLSLGFFSILGIVPLSSSPKLNPMQGGFGIRLGGRLRAGIRREKFSGESIYH